MPIRLNVSDRRCSADSPPRFATSARTRAAEVRLGPGLTVITGRNGAGKTNLLEALYFGCTARSCRTSNEREVVRFGAELTRMELDGRGRPRPRTSVTVGFQPARPSACGPTARRWRGWSRPARPLVSVFLPDRLELV